MGASNREHDFCLNHPSKCFNQVEVTSLLHVLSCFSEIRVSDHLSSLVFENRSSLPDFGVYDAMALPSP